MPLFALAAFLPAAAAWVGDEAAAPDGWHTYAARSEIAPRYWVVRPRGRADEYHLGLAGNGKESTDGRWMRQVPVAGGRYYAFAAEYSPRNVATVSRSVLARILWLDSQGKQLQEAEYPFPGEESAGSPWRPVAGTYQAPAGAVSARLELHLRWTDRGEVLWRRARLSETPPPGARKVRLASVNHRPRHSRSPDVNLEAFLAQVDGAARLKADIVCLPEGITVVGTGKKYADVAEPVPGPSTKRLGEAAAKHRLYIVAGIYERDGTSIYNTSVLIDREGRLAGKYRKVCLPHEEIEGGLTPGREYPVFDTDFGRIGMMICWDLHFPEVARAMAEKGAEVILMPIWGGNETLARARAIENQIFLVASGYDFKTTIYDKAGEPIAEASSDPSVILAEIDLNERLLWPWLGEWRARIWREAPSRR